MNMLTVGFFANAASRGGRRWLDDRFFRGPTKDPQIRAPPEFLHVNVPATPTPRMVLRPVGEPNALVVPVGTKRFHSKVCGGGENSPRIGTQNDACGISLMW